MIIIINIYNVSFVRRMKMTRNLIFDVCVCCVNETNFFLPADEENKQKTLSSFFLSFLFFFTRALFEFFFSNKSNVRPSNAPNFSQGIYLLVHRKQTLFRFENAREHRFISPSKEGCGVGTLSSVDTPSFEQNT